MRTGRLATVAWAPALLLALVWVAQIVLIWPAGDFPLNDDWSYGIAVQRLLAEGRFRPTDWTSMTLVAQVLWGALFCLPFGFSFEALRLSTLTLGLAGVLAFYALLREVGTRPSLALLGSLTLATNPLYVHLACTFMTDVPFLALSIVALAEFVRHLRGGSPWCAIAGSVAAIGAMLIRQTAVVLPLAYAIARLTQVPWRPRALLSALLPAASCFALLAIFERWLSVTNGLPALYRPAGFLAKGMIPSDPFDIAAHVVWMLLVAGMYVGVFAIPVLAATWRGLVETPPEGPGWRFAPGALALVIAALLGATALHHSWRMPLVPVAGNILYDLGLGPITLRDVFFLGRSDMHAPRWLWIIVTTGGVAGVGLLAALVALAAQRCLHAAEDRPLLVLVIALIVLYAPTLLLHSFLDRYLLFLLPLVIVLVALVVGRSASWRGLVIGSIPSLLIFMTFGVAGTHDYFAWNRARWELLAQLQRDGVSPAEIDGGFEFGGVRRYDRARRPPPGKSWWWVDDDRYMLTLGPVDGYETFQSREFFRWLRLSESAVQVLKRTEAATR